METLKKRLKDWENGFYKAHSKKPEKHDIKANPQIAALYKEYNKLRKAGQKAGQKTHDKTPKKSVSEIGPTPQLNGRIVGIFELQTPRKEVEESPSNRRLNSKVLDSSSIESSYTTPTHQRFTMLSPKTEATPYLGQRAVVVLTQSPKSKSPMKRLAKKRTLCEIFKEVQEMKMGIDDDQVQSQIDSDLREQQLLADIEKEDMKNGLIDQDRLEIAGDMGRQTNEFEFELKEDDVVEKEEEPKSAFWVKSKKIKRQTRRTKMKGVGNQEEAQISDDEEITTEMDLLKQKQLENESCAESESEGEESEIEEEGEEPGNFMKKNIDVGVESSKKKVYRNFRRYKLQKRGGGGRWKRR